MSLKNTLTNVHIYMVERANHSVAEVLENLELVHKVLVKRKNQNFTSLDSSKGF